MRALVVDDEPHARRMLRGMLERRPGVEVVAEAATVGDALELTRRHEPDVIFLDVQMPGPPGTQLPALLDGAGPALVFVTAYERYAVAAFDLNAVDYLLKPFDDDRLAEALARVRGRMAAQDGARHASPGTDTRERPLAWLFVSRGDRTLVRRAADVERIEVRRKQLHVHIDDEEYSMPGPLAHVAPRLDPTLFVRVSRSDVVNVSRIAEVQPWFAGDLLLILRSGAHVRTTRSYRDHILQLIRPGRRP